MRWWLALAFASALSAATAAERLAAVDDQWKRIRSPNFELYTHGREAESRAVLRDLELLRALFLGTFRLTERAKLDVTVHLFRRTADFAAYAPDSLLGGNFKGFYQAFPDRAIINLAPFEDWDGAQRIVFHEYVHHLFRITEQEPPPWFNEGTAELFSAIRENGRQLEIGQPHVGRIITLQEEKLLPLETLFAVDHGSPIYQGKEHTGIFYAQSWALLHYWNFGESGLPKEGVARFLAVASSADRSKDVELRAFFRKCFGMDYPDMVKRLERYVNGGSYRFGKLPAPDVPKAATYAVQAVPRDELRLRLAELALRTRQDGAGKLLLLEAVDRPGAEPRLLEALGADALLHQDTATARERWEQAVAAGSVNIAMMRELGLLESRGWFREFEIDFRLPVETAQRLRSRLTRAIELEPEQTAAYEMLAWVEAYAAAPVVPNIVLVQRAFPRLKHQPRVLLAFVLTRVRLGLRDQAVAMLEEFDKLEFDQWAATGAEAIRARLEGRLARPVRPPTKENVIHVNATVGGRPRLKTPSVELP